MIITPLTLSITSSWKSVLIPSFSLISPLRPLCSTWATKNQASSKKEEKNLFEESEEELPVPPGQPALTAQRLHVKLLVKGWRLTPIFLNNEFVTYVKTVQVSQCPPKHLEHRQQIFLMPWWQCWCSLYHKTILSIMMTLGPALRRTWAHWRWRVGEISPDPCVQTTLTLDQNIGLRNLKWRGTCLEILSSTVELARSPGQPVGSRWCLHSGCKYFTSRLDSAFVQQFISGQKWKEIIVIYVQGKLGVWCMVMTDKGSQAWQQPWSLQKLQWSLE